jgi:hypothetical protein
MGFNGWGPTFGPQTSTISGPMWAEVPMHPTNITHTSLYPMFRNNAAGLEVGLPGRISADSNRNRTPAGRRPAGGPILNLPEPNPAEIQPGSLISGPEYVLRNIV